MAWKPEVIAGGEIWGNGLRFETRAECDAYMLDLRTRWHTITETLAIEEPGEPNYKFETEGGARLIPIGENAVAYAHFMSDPSAQYTMTFSEWKRRKNEEQKH